TVKINNQLIDAGVDIEVVKKLDVLLGYKYNTVKGNDFTVVWDQFNVIKDYKAFSLNFSQSMIGGGLKYNFSERVYVTLQDHFVLATDGNNSGSTLTINQLYMLFNMTF
ncbi:MAG: hypothetical protein K2Q22_03955, partial [Cytophagales bacterium]|nr:hypothetical protein [Cytophagales bacterium]